MNNMILILDSSLEYGLEIARRLRGEQISAQIAPEGATARQIREIDPKGVILCGELDAANGGFDEEIAKLDIPVLAIGPAAYALLGAMGGAHAGVAIGEKKALVTYDKSALFTGVCDGERYFHEAQTLMLPADVRQTASAGSCTIAFEDEQGKRYGVQFELERNDPDGSAILMNFAIDICGCSQEWTMDAALLQAEKTLAEEAAQGGHAICAVSGGVDSALCALLAHRAFGDKMTAIFVDTGLMREGEADNVQRTMEELGIPMLRVDCAQEILHKLEHRHTMQDKSAVVVGRLNEEMIRRSAAIAGKKVLILGTNYSDYLESGSSASQWRESGMTVVEPLMALFKDEVRAIARKLGMSEEIVDRKPFPSLGLGARIVGEVTASRLHALRTAEQIFREEIQQAGLDRKLYKYFPVLIAGEALGSEMMVLRAVTLSGGQLTPARLPYDLVERTVAGIMAQLPTILRVLYDQTPSQIGQETFY